MIGVILAAGAGRRLGGVAKALLTLADGQSFLEAIAATSRRAGATKLVAVVAEPFAPQVVRAAAALGIETVHNPGPERGMGSSVSLGFEYAIAAWEGDAKSALMWPVDTPLVAASTIRRMHSALGMNAAVLPSYRGRGGHPVLVARRLWAGLATAGELERGARSLFDRHRSELLRLEVGDAAVIADVDRPGDLAALEGAAC